MSAELTAEQVLEGLDQARKLIDRYLPDSVRPSAAAAVDALRKKPSAVDAIALVGGVGLARAHAWWDSVSPFAEVPPPAPLSGTDAALERLYDRGVLRVDRRDAELAAFSAITSALLEVGWDAAKAALPFVIAAVRG